MSLILSIDTALGETSLSLTQNGALLTEFHHPARELQARMLLFWIEELLKSQSAGYSDLDSLSVSVGPGGFTGIRIGLGAARAIAFAIGKPIAGFTTLEILAHSTGAKEVTAVLPAGRGMVFHQQFSKGLVPLTEPGMVELRPETIRGILASSAVALTPDRLVQARDFARLLGELACLHPARFTGQAPVPLYIRPPDATPQSALI